MNGIILVDKPQDWTSHDVVAKLRGVLHERRIGHSGTLDPLATGLLVVFVGRATRAVEFAEADSKEYIAGLHLGVSTDTQDITGNIVAESAALPDEAALREALGRFIGDIEQIPPMYSAIKIGGKKLYELARRGESVERAPRKITVSAIDIAGRDSDDYILNISCSKGTYVRTLCSDIGEALGCGACMSSLRRTRAGVFSVDDAHSLADIEAAVREGRLSDIILPGDTLFASFPKLTVSQSAAKRLKNGNIIKISAEDGEYKVYSDSDEFLLLGRVECGKLKTIKSFYEVS
jgi:tRNA pseudouridine55 synthase